MNEAELIHAARAGDEAAWEALVRQHQKPIFRLAYLKLGDAADAADAAQETLIRAYRSLERFDSSRALRPWLLAIVSNLAANRWRSLARYRRAVERWLDERRGGVPAADERLERQDLWAAVRQMSDDDQNVIYLRYFLELDVKETAQALDIAEGTVKSRASRALERLRQVIVAQYPELQDGMADE